MKRTGKKKAVAPRRHRRLKKGKLEPLRIREDAAGIDVGATELFVAVPPEKDKESVRRFPTFTRDLMALADWLEKCGVRTVAMESTGVYWIPIFQILEERGLEVCLVNAEHLRNVPGRKTDVSDCQWIQQVHSLGLLKASFRPAQRVCALRRILRHREELMRMSGQQIHLMQKALDQMNVQLHHVLSDITGVSGLAILDAILAGERDPGKLAALREKQVKSSSRIIIKALEGDYRSEHLFTLRQSLNLYRFLQSQIVECQTRMREELAGWDARVDLTDQPPPSAGKPIRVEGMTAIEAENLRQNGYRVLGVDLTAVDGINGHFVQVLLTEVGPDLSRFDDESSFANWLRLSPNPRVTGGKVLNSKTRKTSSRMAKSFRMAANALLKSQSALGDCFRRFRAKLGAPGAITALAHKLARIVYHLVTTGERFDTAILLRQQERQKLYHELRIRKTAARMGFKLVPLETP